MFNYHLELLSLNVNGLGDSFKRRSLFEWFKKCKQKLIFLQETHTCIDIESKWKSEWGNDDIYFSHGTTNSKGVAILFKRDFDYKLLEKIADVNGRYLVLRIEVDHSEFVLVNYYAPTKNDENGQMSCLENLRQLLLGMLDKNLIIGGDFNTVLNVELDKKGGSQQNIPWTYMSKLENFLEEFCLIDIWRAKNPDSSIFTWRQRRPLIQCRLDYWFVSEFLVESTKNVLIEPAIKTDHSKIVLELMGNEFNSRGPGFWKFNADLLTDKKYVELVKKTLTECDSKYQTLQDKNLKWDTIKSDIRGATIKFAKEKNRNVRKQEETLYNRQKELEEKLSKAYRDSHINEILTQLDNVKDELEHILDRRTRGAIVRSHAEHCDGYEKQSKYFLSLEKRNYKSKCITKLQVNDNYITSSSDILEEEKTFYSRLYTSKNVDGYNGESNFLNQEAMPELSDIMRQKCDSDLTEAECLKALKTFKNNKSPGTDGLTAEFYKFFWSDIRKYLLESYDYSYRSESLSIDQRRGILTLIPKKDKDRTILGNWRPLSLLNVDYKILAKVIAERMKPYLPHIISSDQTGYVANRYIGDNLRLISDVIFHTNLKNCPGLILLVDFEKAFDTIEWSFIQRALAGFNFGEIFRKWVKILYTDISSCVVNNGYSSSSFKIERGVRQGCPLSPFLFIIGVELLAINIRNNSEIKGIKIGEVEAKISQLADDTTCFFNDEYAARKALDTFKDFEKCSGLKVNYSKTEAIWIGKDKYNKDGSLPIKWSTSFSTLGLKFTVINSDNSFNLEKCFGQMQNVLKVWKPRYLSLIGKVIILKSLAISKLIYVISSEYVPQTYISRIQKEIRDFIWSDGPSKIKFDVIQASIKNGGIKAPNFEHQLLSLRIMWVKRFLSDIIARWKEVANSFFNHFELKDIFFSRCDIEWLELNIPPFYAQVLAAWKSLKSLSTPTNAFQVRKEFIWFNPHIKINKKSIFFKPWYQKGIKFVNDLVNDNGQFLTCDELNRKYNLNITFLEILSIRSAMPQPWKEMLLETTISINSSSYKVIFEYDGKILPLCKMTSKDARDLLLMHHQAIPTVHDKWEDIFNIQISKNQWELIYSLPYFCALESRLQSFQYKILNRIAYHNYLVHKYGYIQSNKCEKCGTIETIEHKYYYCDIVKHLWENFFKWWNNIFNTTITLSLDCIIFGFLEYKNNAFNYCILLGKYYINFLNLSSKSNNISLENYLIFLKRRLEILEFTYLMKDKIETFAEIFGNILQHL